MTISTTARHNPLEETFVTLPSHYPQPLAMSSERLWVDIFNRLGEVRFTRSDGDKKTRQRVTFEWLLCI